MKQTRLNWGAKLLLLLLAFSALPVLAVSYLMYQQFERAHESASLQRLQGLAKTKAESVDQFIGTRLRQVERIALQVMPSFVVVERGTWQLPATSGGELPDPPNKPVEPITPPGPVEELPPMGPEPPPTDDKPPDDEAPEEPEEPEEPEPEPEPSPPSKPPDDENRQIGDDESAHRAQERLRRTLGLLLWEQQDYEELLVIDHEGVVLVSTFDAHEGRSAAGIDYFSNGLRTTYVQPVFMSPITDRLTMMVSTPIRDESQRVVGVVAARLNLSRFFQLLADDTGLGKSGETVVGHKVDSDILFMAPTRHDADAASNRRIPIGGKFSRPLQEAARGQVGSGEAIDYRGQEVLAAWQHIPALNWGLVVKMDRAEAWQAIVEMQRNFAMMMLAVLVAVGLCSMLVARALVAPLRELKEATDRISKGDLDVKLRIASRDEIGELADSFERMVAAIKFFREEAEHERDEVPEGEDDSDSDSDPAGPKTPP